MADTVTFRNSYFKPRCWECFSHEVYYTKTKYIWIGYHNSLCPFLNFGNYQRLQE